MKTELLVFQRGVILMLNEVDLLQLTPDHTILEKLSPYLKASVMERSKSSSFEFSAIVTSQ